MKIIFKHILKNIYEKKLRTAIFLLAVMLSSTVLFISLSVNDILNNTYSTMLQGVYGNGNVLVTKNVDSDYPFFEESDVHLASVDAPERLDMFTGVGVSELKGEMKQLSVIGLDLADAVQMNVIHPLDLHSEPGNNEGVIISAKTAEKYNLAIGDVIDVEIGDAVHSFMVSRLSASNGLYYSELDDIILVTSLERINKIYQTENLLTSTLLKINTNKLMQSVDELKKANPVFTIAETNQTDTIMRDEGTFQTTMLVAIVIIVMISAYVISSLTKLVILERMPVVGTLRSIGATKGLTNRIIRMEFLLYGIVGTILGLIIGCLLLPVAADSFNEYKQYGVETIVEYNSLYLVIVLLFGAFFPMIISSLHTFRRNKKQLKAIILDTSHTVKEQSMGSSIIGSCLVIISFIIHIINRYDKLVFALISVFLLFVAIVLLMPLLLNIVSKLLSILFSPLFKGEANLGIKNVANNKITSNNAGMIIIVLLLLLMIGVTSAGVERHINGTLVKDYDLVMYAEDLEQASFSEIETTSGISDVLFQQLSLAQYDIAGDQETFTIYGVDDLAHFKQFFSGVVFPEDITGMLDSVDNGIIIDTYQAKRYDLAVGDTFLLEALGEDFRVVNDEELALTMEVTGIINIATLSSNKDAVLISLDFFEKHFEGFYNQMFVKVLEDADVNDVKENIKKRYITEDIEVQTFDEMLASQKQVVDSLLQGILIIILLGVMIGLLGITNNLLVSFMERKKEFAVLYSVCMSKGQLVKTVIYEMLVTFISVVVISLIGAIGMNIVWTRLLYAVGLRIEFSLNYSLFLMLVGAVFLLLSIATIFILRKVWQLNIIKELRYE